MRKFILLYFFFWSTIAGKAAIDIPISYHTRTDINMLDCKADAGGEYTFLTTGADPYVSSDRTSITTADHSIFSFEYIAEDGIDQVMIYFSNPASEGYTAFVSNLPPTAVWKTATINFRSNPNWEKTAVQTVLRLDLGNIAGKTIKIRNTVMKATLVAPLTLNISNINEMTVSEAAGEYTLSTTGTDPFIYANQASVASSDVFILSFDYIADAGINEFQFYFYADGETLSDDKSAIKTNLAPTTDWKNASINLKNSDGMWNQQSLQSNFRIDVGTESGKIIKLRKIAVRDGSGLLITSFPVNLANGSQSADMSVTENPAGTWNIQTSGSDPNMGTVGFREMYNPSLVKYLSFEYKSSTGLSDMDVYFYNPTNGSPSGGASGDYLVHPGTSIPPASEWTEFIIDMSISSRWKDAGTFRLDFGNDASRDFQIRTIKLSDNLNISRTVNYDSQSEIVVNPLNTYYKAIISAPTLPMRLGYALTGWFKETECLNSWNFADEMVLSNLTLFAKWSEVDTFTVTFDSQGGSAVPEMLTNDNTCIPAPEAPSKSFYEFEGWYRETACINSWNFETDKVSSNTTLFAKWVGYSVYFDSRGGSAVAKINVDYNAAIPEPEAPTREGYVFEGWHKEFLCINPWDFATEKVTGTTTLFARWMGSGIQPLTVGTAPSRLQYFGFYLIDTNVDDVYDGVKKSDYTDEVAGFSNLNHMAVFNPTDNIVTRVNSMKSQCMKPFLGIENIFFYVDGDTNSPSGRHFAMYSDYKARWNTFKITNSPILNASKIGCFYMADEPTWNGITFAELNTACELVKKDFPSIPVFFIEAYPVIDILEIPVSVDWVGFDRYWIMKPASDASYLADLAMIKTKLSSPNQKIFLVPDTRWIPQYQETFSQSPEEMDATILDYYKIAVADTTIIGLIGYEWPGGFDGAGTLGARNLPQNVIDILVQMGRKIIANNTYCPLFLPPSLPTNLTASDIGLTKCNLSWTASPANVSGIIYEVHRNGFYVGTTSETSINIPGLSCATSYQMTVKAKYEGSNWSIESSPLSVTTIDCVPCTLPEGWNGADIGTTNQTACEYDGTFTYTGTGVEAAGNLYNYRYTYTALNGDGIITARVDNILNPDPTAKTGIMMSERLTSGSKFAACYVSKENGIMLQFKSGSSIKTNAVVSGITAPCWIRLARTGDVFNAQYSTDGIVWIQVGTSVTIAMASDIYRGFTVISRKECFSCTSEISTVSVGSGTGVSEPTGISNGIAVFPNPVITILSISNVSENSIISVFSIEGKLREEIKVKGNDIIQLDVSAWQKGIYFLKIQSGSFVNIEKLVVE